MYFKLTESQFTVHSRVRDFLHSHFKRFHTIIVSVLYNTVYIFLLCRLKINHMKELCHLHLFLGAWLRPFRIDRMAVSTFLSLAISQILLELVILNTFIFLSIILYSYIYMIGIKCAGQNIFNTVQDREIL
jgi:hypothetical protein